jgi:hypothetical protein
MIKIIEKKDMKEKKKINPKILALKYINKYRKVFEELAK